MAKSNLWAYDYFHSNENKYKIIFIFILYMSDTNNTINIDAI